MTLRRSPLGCGVCGDPTPLPGRRRTCDACKRAAAAAASARFRRTNPNYRQYPESKWRSHLRTRYGITPEERDALFAKHDGLCWLPSCDRPATDTDHCHENNVVRGALCSPHNIGLGHLGDNVEGLIEALQYLLAAS